MPSGVILPRRLVGSNHVRLLSRMPDGGTLCANRCWMLARRDAVDHSDKLAVDVARAIALRVHVQLSLAHAFGVSLRHTLQERLCIIVALALHFGVRHGVAVAVRNPLSVADAHAVARCDRMLLCHAHSITVGFPHALAMQLCDDIALALLFGLQQRIAEHERGRDVACADGERPDIAVAVAVGKRGVERE